MSGALSTAQANALLLEVWPTAAPGKAPPISQPAKHAILALWRHETGYGNWSGDMAGSHNLGAMQCPKTGSDCSAGAQNGKSCALWSDTKDGRESTRFPQCFEVFPDWPTAIRASLRTLSPERRPLTSAALATGNLKTIADAMHHETYFTADPGVYAKALWRNAKELAPLVGEPLAVFLDAPPPAPGPLMPANTGPATSDAGGELALLGLGLGVGFLVLRRGGR